MKDEDIEVGTHLWVTSSKQLLIVLKTSIGYDVCGPWECGISFDKFQIIEIIPRPKGHENTKLYYI